MAVLVSAAPKFQHTSSLREAETLHLPSQPHPEFPTDGPKKVSRPGLEISQAEPVSLFCSVMKNRKRGLQGIPISQRNTTENSAVCFATILPSCPFFVLPFGLRIPFLMIFDAIGLEILLLLHDITGRGDDLQYPSFSLLPLQNTVIVVNFGGDGPDVFELR
jgi:hypothetical protein